MRFLTRASVAIAICACIILAVFVYIKIRSISGGSYFVSDLIIAHGTILTLDNSERVLEDGWIQIHNGKIAKLGTGQPPTETKEYIDAKGKTIMPGLINGHSHLGATVLRDSENSSDLSEWLARIEVYEQKLTPDDIYWSSKLGMLEMIRTGTTTFNEMYFAPEETIKAATQLGLRGIVRVPVVKDNDIVTVDKSFIEKYKNNSLLSFSVAPNPLVEYGPGELANIRQQLGQLSLLTHVHIASEKDELSVSQSRWQKSPLEVLTNAGLLAGSAALVHASYLTESDLATVAQYPTAGIILTPKSEFKLNQWTSLRPATILAAGVPVALGTDGPASSTGFDMFGEINFTATALAACAGANQYCEAGHNLKPQKILSMATREAAQILGLTEVTGSIEVGKNADIIIIDTSQTKFIPSRGPFSKIVYYANGADVVDSIIDGKIIMRDRKLLGVDEDQIQRKVMQIRSRIFE